MIEHIFFLVSHKLIYLKICSILNSLGAEGLISSVRKSKYDMLQSHCPTKLADKFYYVTGVKHFIPLYDFMLLMRLYNK